MKSDLKHPSGTRSFLFYQHISLKTRQENPPFKRCKAPQRERLLKQKPVSCCALRAQEDLEAQRAESVLRVRVEALAVARHLHQQGLVNPMTVLPKASRNPHAAAFRNAPDPCA